MLPVVGEQGVRSTVERVPLLIKRPGRAPVGCRAVIYMWSVGFGCPVLACGAGTRLVVAALVKEAVHPALVGVEHRPKPPGEPIVVRVRVVPIQRVGN